MSKPTMIMENDIVYMKCLKVNVSEETALYEFNK